MKGDLAKAQREALRYIITQKNPAVPLSFRGKQMLGLSTEKGMIPVSKQVGKSGAWSTAYLSFVDEKPTVFIETSGEDISKDVLVAINEQGHHPHIPIIEYFGTGRGGTKIYKMPLYDTQSELAMKSRYGKVIDILRQATEDWYTSMTRQERYDYANNVGVWDKIVLNNIQRNAFIKYLEDVANYPTLMEPHFLSQKDKDTLSSIIEDLKVMNTYLTDNDMVYFFEFPTRNLALDGNQQLILLDVMYPYEI